MNHILSDFRLAWRSLRRSPQYTLACTLAMALGLGASAAVYSVVSALYLRPLPFRNDHRLVVITSAASAGIPSLSRRPTPRLPDFLDFEQEHDLFAGATGYMVGAVNLAGPELPFRLNAALVSPSFLGVLGIRPLIGRQFDSTAASDGSDEVYISEGLWRTAFGSDRQILGRSLDLNGRPYVVTAVLPHGMTFPAQSDVWLPLRLPFDRRNWDMFQMALNMSVVARLRDGVSLPGAQARASILALHLSGDSVGARRVGAGIVPLRTFLTAGAGPSVLMLLAAATVLLLITCINIAHLVIARVVAQRRDIAIAAALGASRARIVEGVMAEVALLAAIGGVFGLGVAPLTFRFLSNLLPTGIVGLNDIRLDGRTLALTLLALLIVAAISGLMPALGVVRTDLHRALTDFHPNAVALPSGQTARILVVIQVALSVVLLAGAGLMASSLLRLSSVNPGFQSDNVYAASMELPLSGYLRPERKVRFFAALLNELHRTPGVVVAAVASDIPWSGGMLGSPPVRVPGLTPEQVGMTIPHEVSTGYFRALRIPLLRGRTFSETDQLGGPSVAIIDRRMATTLWPNDDPIGKSIFLFNDTVPTEVVGVVGDVQIEPPSILHNMVMSQIYLPMSERPQQYATVLLRSSEVVPPAATMENAVRKIDPSIPLYKVTSMQRVLSDAITAPRVRAILLMTIGGLALVLSSLGVFTVVTYAVTRRLRDFGIRVALGATAWQLFGSIMLESVGLSFAGTVLGLIGSLWATQLLSGLLYQVAPGAPLPLIAAAVLLVVVTALASVPPAVRAIRADPVATMRTE